MNNNELENLHQCHLELIDEFDKVCKQLGLSYFLDSGTALGAVRHGGFIPWDDDVDVGMLREDYEKFMRQGQALMSDKFFIQNRETEPNYGKFGGKLRMNNTFFPERSSVSFQNQGIFIDIYPFDFVNDNRRKALRSLKVSRLFIRFIRFRDARGIYKNVFKKMASLSIQIIPKKWLDDKYEQYCKKLNGKGMHFLTCYSYRMAKTMDLIFPVDALTPTKCISFEDREYQIMNDPNAYLTEMYGDYMQLPPEERRVYHVRGDIIFDLTKEKDKK